MAVTGIARPVLVVLIVVAGLLFAIGATWAVAFATHHSETHTRTLPAGASIEIDSDHGDVRVVGGDRADVKLTTKERRSVFGRPHVRVSYADGRLRLHTSCSGAELFANECAASYVVEVPRAMAVRVAASAADVHAEDVRGRLTVHVSSGDVHVDAPSPDIVATASSGDIHVHASDATLVRAEASSGDIHVSVPDRTYAVQTHATSGDQSVHVHDDPDAPRKLVVSTTSGDLHVESDG
ncbi:MAG TPA: DUF4097 family beta strand repeat-containing protein [Solirubrobacteraceae bacterium]|jgi:DUF4097 and DUF4098 domain-containing protein YvlB